MLSQIIREKTSAEPNRHCIQRIRERRPKTGRQPSVLVLRVLGDARSSETSIPPFPIHIHFHTSYFSYELALTMPSNYESDSAVMMSDADAGACENNRVSFCCVDEEYVYCLLDVPLFLLAVSAVLYSAEKLIPYTRFCFVRLLLLFIRSLHQYTVVTTLQRESAE